MVCQKPWLYPGLFCGQVDGRIWVASKSTEKNPITLEIVSAITLMSEGKRKLGTKVEIKLTHTLFPLS